MMSAPQLQDLHLPVRTTLDSYWALEEFFVFLWVVSVCCVSVCCTSVCCISVCCIPVCCIFVCCISVCCISVYGISVCNFSVCSVCCSQIVYLLMPLSYTQLNIIDDWIILKKHVTCTVWGSNGDDFWSVAPCGLIDEYRYFGEILKWTFPVGAQFTHKRAALQPYAAWRLVWVLNADHHNAIAQISLRLL